jgi:hypothetical protein
MQGLCVVLGSITVTVAALAAALAWGPHQCKAAFPMIIGCAMGSYESLSGGMIAAAAALMAGWLAWSAVQVQIDAEERRAVADRTEVEKVLRQNVDSFAEALGAMWKIIDTLVPSAGAEIDQTKIKAVKYGIGEITKINWLSTSRRMVTVLGWERRRKYEELFDGLEGLRSFLDIAILDASTLLMAVRDLSIDFEYVHPDTHKYFKGLFRRSVKARTLGMTIEYLADCPP